MARIRAVEFTDLETIIAIEKEAFSEPWDELTLKAELFLYKNSYYYILEDEEIMGYGGYILENDIRHLSTVALFKKYQNQGFGKEFIKFLTEGKAYLEVSVNNEKAISLYKSLGFKKKYILKDYYSDSDAYYMEKGD